MFKLGCLIATLLIGSQASANYSAEMTMEVTRSVVEQTIGLGSGWTVGDTADYSLNGGFIKGTMKIFVREEVSEGMWIQQDMDLGFMGKQKIEILYAPNGTVLAMLVNGEKQTPPDPADQEIIEMKDANVTVPKGTFDCTYVKIKDVKSGNITEAWIDLTREVPVTGMIKTMAPSQIGTITVELTGYKKM